MAETHTSHTTFHMVYGVIVVVLLLVLAGVVYHYHKEVAALRSQHAPMMMGMKGHMGGGMPGMTGMSMAAVTPAPLTAEQQQQLTDGTSTATTQKTFTIDGGNFYFSPNKITVNKGDTVTINFKNDGGVHDFVIDALNVKSDVTSTGKTETFSFVASKTGTFQFYCSIPAHKQKGMWGTLIVQ